MKLGCCLLASDLNPDYLDFFPLVQKAWKEAVGVEVRMVLIAQELPRDLRQFEGAIRLFRPVLGLHTAFQAQCVRLLFPALLHDECRDAVLISDMDMLPLSRRYFTQPLENLGADKFVMYRAGVLHGQVPIGYNAALASTWWQIFPAIRDETDVAQVLGAWWAEGKDYGIRKGAGWFTDQDKLHSHLNAWEAAAGKGRLVRLTDGKTGLCRLDRSRPEEFRRNLARQSHLLRAGYFTDFHMMQPPSEHEALNLQVFAEAHTPPSPSDRALAAVRKWARACRNGLLRR